MHALLPYGARGGVLSKTALARAGVGHTKVVRREHSFMIEQLDPNRVRFVQQEVLSGILVSLLGGTLSATKRGFEEMNAALKTLAEKST
jgi:hypothetical protein